MKDTWNVAIVDGNENVHHLDEAARTMINEIIIGQSQWT
jgi:hypothetical protein